ncbi:ATP-binding protein [Pseudonocardia sp.]|uniref:ATP-binding protein n=1 Tax=Pseudonocardia sp. TaxID=60912 RepID=UPI0039C8F5B3
MCVHGEKVVGSSPSPHVRRAESNLRPRAARESTTQDISRGLAALARRSTVLVDLDLDLDLTVDRRLPKSAEFAADYVVAEALTNAAKHARASQINLCAEVEGMNLRVSIRDDGIGGAARPKDPDSPASSTASRRSEAR